MRKLLRLVIVVVVCYFIAVISNIIFLEQIVIYAIINFGGERKWKKEIFYLFFLFLLP